MDKKKFRLSQQHKNRPLPEKYARPPIVLVDDDDAMTDDDVTNSFSDSDRIFKRVPLYRL